MSTQRASAFGIVVVTRSRLQCEGGIEGQKPLKCAGCVKKVQKDEQCSCTVLGLFYDPNPQRKTRAEKRRFEKQKAARIDWNQKRSFRTKNRSDEARVKPSFEV
ncbi:hypothetical protein [Prosthecobacter sp.]|uniref:hypothetical protein n=1 Tax=Prosthecobacter sp. TaxID=1965333 RepID=UPI003784B7C7